MCYPADVQPEARTLARALEGDARAIRALVDLLAPVIHARVTRILFTRFRSERDLAEAAADGAQEVFAVLFAEDGKVLRSWDPERGLSLQNFVGLVAERNALSQLRAGSRAGVRERATTDDDLVAQAGVEASPESGIGRRMLFDAVVARVESELTPQGKRLFELLFIEDRAIEDICAEVGMTADAAYAWRSRLLKAVRRVTAEIESGTLSESAAPERTPGKRTLS